MWIIALLGEYRCEQIIDTKKIFLSNSYSYSIKISNSWDTNTYSQFWKSSPKKLIYYSLINLHKLLSAKGIDIIYLLQKNLNTYLFLYVRFRAKNRLLWFIWKADLHLNINSGFAFIRWIACSVKTLVS